MKGGRMKLYKFKRILKKDELLTIETYANDKVNVVLEQIRDEIEQSRYGLVNDGLDLALKIIDKYIKGENK